jgi:alkanesulfonate monooxygenase SsuD/methylene tetrahydromethanopterin reductase-like flavin-dependent oxidoreductase (luciferase family)
MVANPGNIADRPCGALDIVFTAQHPIGGAREFRSDIRRRATAYGRDPNSVKVPPAIYVVLARTMDEANDKKAALEDALTVDQKLRGLFLHTFRRSPIGPKDGRQSEEDLCRHRRNHRPLSALTL